LEVLAESPALWNRTGLDLGSDEVLAQLLDRGRVVDWRALYALARESPELRGRIVRVCQTVPIGFAHLFLAAMAGLGERVDTWPPARRGVGEDWV
jgi:hypothetical protein